MFLYLSLYSLVLPFSFMESIYNGIKNANGRPEAPFIRMVLMLALRIFFNFLFIYWFRFGIVGSVLASLLANVIITVWMFHEMFVKQGPGPPRAEGLPFRLDDRAAACADRFSRHARRSFMLNLGFFLINTETEKYGPIVLNGQGIASNITTLCFTLPGAFSAAVTTMVSMNIGAGNPDKARKSCITSDAS